MNNYSGEYNWIGITGVLVVSLALAACSHTKDVTLAYASPAGYEPGNVYVVKQDLFVDAGPPGFVETQSMVGTPPPSIHDVEMNPNHWNEFRGILKRGTLLKFAAFKIYHDISTGSVLLLLAKVKSGSLKGHTVEISSISQIQGGPDAESVRSARPNPAYLAQRR